VVVLREVVPGSRVDGCTGPVHPGARGALVVLQRVVWVSALSTDGERRRGSLVKLHARRAVRSEVVGAAFTNGSWLDAPD